MSTHAVVIVELDDYGTEGNRNPISGNANNVISASFDNMPLDFIKEEVVNEYTSLPYAEKDATKLQYCKTRVKKGDKFIAVYVHWDGDTIINVLKNHAKTHEDAIKIVSYGYLSVIQEEGILPYMFRTGKGVQEESDWNLIKPRTYKTLKGCIRSFSCEYAWLFTKENKWMSANIDSETRLLVLKKC
jgi:hypothetical protein